MSSDIQTQIVERAQLLGLALDDLCASRLCAYLDLLKKWSRTMRLVGRATTDDLLLHIQDSLAVARLPLPGEAMVDIGSGAGFPGIPLATLNPDRPVLLVESRMRRAAFLKEAARTMELRNVEVRSSRFEEIEIPEGAFAVGRAVAPPARFLAMVEERGLRKAVLMINESMLQGEYLSGWEVEKEDHPPLLYTPAHINLLCSKSE